MKEVIGMKTVDLHRRMFELAIDKSVVDVGSGMADYAEELVGVSRYVKFIDAHWPYVKALTARLKRKTNAEVHELDARHLVSYGFMFQADVVFAIDVIEHLHMNAALKVIAALKEMAPVIACFIPEGNHPQEDDAYGMGGEHWQTHRSTWTPEKLEELGFNVERWVDFHAVGVKVEAPHVVGVHDPNFLGAPHKDPHAMWAVWRR